MYGKAGHPPGLRGVSFLINPLATLGVQITQRKITLNAFKVQFVNNLRLKTEQVKYLSAAYVSKEELLKTSECSAILLPCPVLEAY